MISNKLRRKRVLITGGSGLLAINWACAVRDDWDVILGIHRHKVNLDGVRTYLLELENTELLERQLAELSPDLVIHTAGMTSVDQCEQEPELAEQINASLARNIAIATAKSGVSLVHQLIIYLRAVEKIIKKRVLSIRLMNMGGLKLLPKSGFKRRTKKL